LTNVEREERAALADKEREEWTERKGGRHGHGVVNMCMCMNVYERDTHTERNNESKSRTDKQSERKKGGERERER